MIKIYCLCIFKMLVLSRKISCCLQGGIYEQHKRHKSHNEKGARKLNNGPIVQYMYLWIRFLVIVWFSGALASFSSNSIFRFFNVFFIIIFFQNKNIVVLHFIQNKFEYTSTMNSLHYQFDRKKYNISHDVFFPIS